VLEAQLFADSFGKIALTRANLWIVDKSTDETRMCAALERRLKKTGTGAAVNTSRFRVVNATRILAKEVLHKSASAVLSTDDVVSAIGNAVMGSGAKPYMIPKHTVGGLEVPIATNGTPAHDVPLDQLGPELKDPLYLDLRVLFPSTQRQPNVRQLGNALEQLSDDGYITIYGELMNSVDILVIHATFEDPWFQPSADGSA
jgi:hypothetical protein